MTDDRDASDIEVLRRIYERWDAGGLARSSFAEDVEIFQMARFVDTAGRFTGHDGLVACVQEVTSAFEEQRWVPHAYHPFASGYAVPLSVEVRANLTGIEGTFHVWHIWTLRAGKVTRLHVIDAD